MLAESWVKGICLTGVLGFWHGDLGWGQYHWVSAVLIRYLTRVTAGWRDLNKNASSPVAVSHLLENSLSFSESSTLRSCSPLFLLVFFLPPRTYAAVLCKGLLLCNPSLKPENTKQQGATVLRFDWLSATIKIFQIWLWLVTLGRLMSVCWWDNLRLGIYEADSPLLCIYS